MLDNKPFIVWFLKSPVSSGNKLFTGLNCEKYRKIKLKMMTVEGAWKKSERGSWVLKGNTGTRARRTCNNGIKPQNTSSGIYNIKVLRVLFLANNAYFFFSSVHTFHQNKVCVLFWGKLWWEGDLLYLETTLACFICVLLKNTTLISTKELRRASYS